MTTHAPRPYQLDLEQRIYAAWAGGARNVIAVLPTGSGKCLGKGTPVMLYSGEVIPVEDVCRGDRLMGPDSKPRTVVSTCHGREPLYRVTPTKGDSYVVNESHILSLKRTGIRSAPRYKSQVGGEIVNVSVRDYLSRSNTFRHEHKGYRAAVDFPEQTEILPIDPYLLGIWLGDGHSSGPLVTTGDPEIVAFLETHAAEIGMTTSKVRGSPGCEILRMKNPESNRWQRNPLKERLRDLGVLNDKHVPFCYQTASRSVRYQLLAGILDSDGYYDGKCFCLTLVNEQLLDDAIFVARSLGFAAYKRPVRKTCGNNGVTGDYWTCVISGHLDRIPCKLPRHAATPRRQIKDVLVTGLSVTPIGEGEYFGFEITGDGLFLLGDFTVTHNTFVVSRVVSATAGAVCVIAHRSELVSQMSVALAREGVAHRVIGPESLRRLVTQMHMREFRRSFYDPNARVAVAGVNTLVNRTDDPFLAQVALWVQDECFPAGTLVDGCPIETIQVGGFVTAFDEKTGTFHKRRVLKVSRNSAPNIMIHVSCSRGGNVTATPAHPFWTSRGWVAAFRLVIGDEVIFDGRQAVVTGVAIAPTAGDVYNFEVDEFHTYVANGFVVHNCHHVLAENTWGRAAAMFPNARGLGVTATPCRADGKGLGRHADGLMDVMVIGPTMRELIEQGFLTEYRVLAPASSIDLSNVPVTGSGDYSPERLKQARQRSTITGDVVKHYLKWASGKLGVVFDTDIENATETTTAFRDAGIRAELITGKTADLVRAETLQRFRDREIQVLVNVDLFGEGFDLPALEVVQFARPTQSYGLYVQQFGRSLRPSPGKDRALIIDHVGNVARHGLPDAAREWSLDRRDRASRSAPADVIPLRTCLNPECLAVYERVLTECPYCGHAPVPAARSAPEFVDGDLVELDPEVLAALRGEAARLLGPVFAPVNATPEVRGAITKRHNERRSAQVSLQAVMAIWGGWQTFHLGRSEREAQRRFFHAFGTDVATAHTLSASEATVLAERVQQTLDREHVVMKGSEND